MEYRESLVFPSPSVREDVRKCAEGKGIGVDLFIKVDSLTM